MRNFISVIFLFVIAIGLTNCKTKKTQIGNLDSKLWKADMSGCDGYRKNTIYNQDLDLQLLIGFNEKDVINMLGKPNETLLYDRAQKFFNYSISCDSTMKPKEVVRLRFNALGYINESLILQK